MGAQRSGSQNSCLPQPAQLGGGPLRTLVHGPQARQKKKEAPAGSPQPEKVGPGRKNLFLPGVLSSGFLPKKAGLPPGAGRATGRCAPRRLRRHPPEGTQHRAAPGRWSGFGPAQVQTCNVGSRPVPGGGSRLSLEKARTQRVAGEDPRPPFFRARSFPLARFGDCCPGSVRGAVSSEILRPIWDAFPGKMRPKSVLGSRRE